MALRLNQRPRETLEVFRLLRGVNFKKVLRRPITGDHWFAKPDMFVPVHPHVRFGLPAQAVDATLAWEFIRWRLEA